MQALLLREMSGCLARGVEDGVFCGAQAAWYVDGQIGRCAAGRRYIDGPPVTDDTRFDIASLTKLFTTAVALRLSDRRVIDLSMPIGEFTPSLPKGSIWRHFTVEQVLAHETGLPDWQPYFEGIDSRIRGREDGMRAILDMVFSETATALENGASRYSDIGFIGLSEILSRRASAPFDLLVAREVTRAVGLDETAFFPVGTPVDPATAFARTEECPWRGRVLDGEVHDDNAFAMGGVAGHAGLFSSARDICTFGAAWLASLDNSGWISRDAAERALTRRPGGRGLGFDAKSPTGSAAGAIAGPRTMGHLGFTGTSIWLDPDRRAVIVLLSNRVHPTRHNEAIRTFRPQFHDVFFGSI